MRSSIELNVARGSGRRPVLKADRDRERVRTEQTYYNNYSSPLYVVGRYLIDDADDSSDNSKYN